MYVNGEIVRRLITHVLLQFIFNDFHDILNGDTVRPNKIFVGFNLFGFPFKRGVVYVKIGNG